MSPEEHERDDMVATDRATAGRNQPRDSPPETVRERYDRIEPYLDRCRVDTIDGSLIVSPIGSPEHQSAAFELGVDLKPVAKRNGWKVYAGLDVILPGSRVPYTPDVVIAPPDAPRWGKREVFTDGVILVAEIVSPESKDRDRDKKPDIYAGGGVPLMLLIDPLSAPPTATVFSDPTNGHYTRAVKVDLGEPLEIPEPMNCKLDTSVFLDEE